VNLLSLFLGGQPSKGTTERAEADQLSQRPPQVVLDVMPLPGCPTLKG